ncbi:MAG: chromosome segregation protein SMC, partial [bacterium]
MRLKRITLHGFKTFADKTEIEFAPGVTAIVGPNGSGKSNLLDALTWCLGEQKASSVRATRAQDVIFAGSSRRKPMGMAEVSLTVDNEDGFLPLNFSEVTITRRVYRSGEGEYFINKAHCRLKDITDLFLDTGVGRGAYAIVNQNEIDAILSARAEDRRELFEEAAGIKKYRVRKREAQRKLDQTEQNLVRIRDIALEIEGNLAPMEEQALTASRFRELSERLREIEVGLLAADYKRLQDELTELGRMAVDADAEADSQRNEATTLEASASELMARISDAESEMDRARLLQQTALSEGERVEGRIALGRERRAAAIRTVETVELDVAGLAEEKARQEAEAKAFAEAANEAELRLSTLSRELQSAEATAKEAERTLIDLSRAVAGQEADYLELARRLAAQKAELDSLRVRLAERADSLRRAEEATMVRQAESEAAKSDAMRLAQEAESAQASFLEAQRILTQEQQPAYQKAVERANSLSERRVVQERRLTEQAARLRALEETEAAREGYFAGVRSVAQAMQKGQLRGRYQPFADAIRVPAELDTAIEAALGGSLQDIITDTEIEAKTAVAHLRETRGGRATFLPLDVLRDVDVPDALRKSARQYSGVMGSAADLVSFDADVRIAVHLHLARVLLVDDLDTATRVSRQLPNREWSRIVTLTGEVVVPTGAITGGANARSGPNLLGRRREVSDLTESVKSARIA